ncbi:ATP-grasp domain-containing protein [Streptomyces sp. JJ38]|uniref:ATP-grasp domain-containing protein n=1 Tax=Streptomyces sp. JJ38 TaxID=2738128 RepID=UPI001C5A0F18|nr:ATP-grasp domain-containing protein [Streptomyces sp. JJ38]MBW1595854.1 ATP-grasp domain-containing protein [Streptomyces sp. JJ38]
MTSRHIALVDTYALSQRLAAGFASAGFTPIRVQSTVEVPALYEGKPDPHPYAAEIVHEGDVAKTAEQVAAFRPLAVVAGGEIGVELADALSEHLAEELGLPTNGTALSRARRDKFAMIETVKSHGLHGAEQIRVADEDELAEWHRKLGRRVVLKPLRSAANDGVQWCDTPEESVRAFRRLSGRRNIFSEPGDGVVAQEYLVGAEYLLNTVSRNGRHHVCDIWKTYRISANGIRDLAVAVHLLPRRGEVQEQVVDYGFRALDALGIQHGPAHVEVKMTPQGPCLVELGARVSGLDLPGYTARATGESQISWTVDAYTDPERFLARCDEDYVMRRSVAWAGMVSPVGGRLLGYRGLEELRGLESVEDVRVLVAPGDTLHPTVDDSTYPMSISMAHDVDEVLLRDLGTVRYLDGRGFYEVEATPAG